MKSLRFKSKVEFDIVIGSSVKLIPDFEFCKINLSHYYCILVNMFQTVHTK